MDISRTCCFSTVTLLLSQRPSVLLFAFYVRLCIALDFLVCFAHCVSFCIHENGHLPEWPDVKWTTSKKSGIESSVVPFDFHDQPVCAKGPCLKDCASWCFLYLVWGSHTQPPHRA